MTAWDRTDDGNLPACELWIGSEPHKTPFQSSPHFSTYGSSAHRRFLLPILPISVGVVCDIDVLPFALRFVALTVVRMFLRARFYCTYARAARAALFGISHALRARLRCGQRAWRIFCAAPPPPAACAFAYGDIFACGSVAVRCCCARGAAATPLRLRMRCGARALARHDAVADPPPTTTPNDLGIVPTTPTATARAPAQTVACTFPCLPILHGVSCLSFFSSPPTAFCRTFPHPLQVVSLPLPLAPLFARPLAFWFACLEQVVLVLLCAFIR